MTALGNQNINLVRVSDRTDLSDSTVFASSKAVHDMKEEVLSQFPINLFDVKWSDHLLNDVSWLRADTFSWHSGDVYSVAYNELLSEYNNTLSTDGTDGDIAYKQTPKGYRIALATEESDIVAKYSADGVAWYYILDTDNRQFKLPRTKFGFTGIRDSVGGFVSAGLPNIEGDTDPETSFRSGATSSTPSGSGAIRVDKGWGQVTVYSTNTTGYSGFSFDASRSNPIYGNSTTVQPPSTQMYLYFYVGNYTRDAIAQTAGLSAEQLNNKLDIDGYCKIPATTVSPASKERPCVIVETWRSGTEWYRVWSDGWIEQGGTINKSLSDSTFYTQNLFKSFSDAKYAVFTQSCKDYDFGTNMNNVTVNGTKTISSFQYAKYEGGNPSTLGRYFISWYACGY